MSIGEVFTAPLDVKLQPGLVLQPDILVVPDGVLRAHGDIVNRLLLAVEAISPSSARYDRVIKRPAYQRNRVPEYWVVDERSGTVERWRPDDERPEILSEQLVWQSEGANEPFVLDLVAFSAEIAVPESRADGLTSTRAIERQRTSSSWTTRNPGSAGRRRSFVRNAAHCVENAAAS